LRGGFARIAKRTLNDAGKFWHEDMLPNHFEAPASAQYNFARRDSKYLELKREGRVSGARGQRSVVDLVLTGKSKRFLEHLATIRGTSKKVTITMKAPSYFTRRVAGQPDKVREVTEFSAKDIRSLKRFIGKRINRLVAKQMKNPSERIVA
jgi:hypothetical protein